MQAAFTNIIRHANATEATVSTGVAAGDIVVSVADNGKGLDTTAPPAAASPTRPANAMRAKLTVESGAQGTKPTQLLPIRQWGEGVGA